MTCLANTDFLTVFAVDFVYGGPVVDSFSRLSFGFLENPTDCSYWFVGGINWCCANLYIIYFN